LGCLRVKEGVRVIITGDCLEVLQSLKPDSFDACVTDPPYGVGSWDNFGEERSVERSAEWNQVWIAAVARVLKPGAHLLVFNAAKTFHRVVLAVEGAGLEYRDCLMWLYGSGFPKSQQVSRFLDRKAGVEAVNAGDVAREKPTPRSGVAALGIFDRGESAPIKYVPQSEEGRKWAGWGTALRPGWEPIVLARKNLDGTVADSVLKHGVGAINVDACRTGLKNRWPANVIVNQEVSEEASFDADRHFFCPKVSPSERNNAGPNEHPTVKPVELMRWLVRLVTPPGGTVLDPFAGSGSTGIAARREGLNFLGVEKNPEYADVARRRVEACKENE